MGINRLPEKKVPVCYICGEEVRAAIEKNLSESEARWAETLKRKAELGLGTPTSVRIASSAGYSSSDKKDSKARGTPSLDQL